MNQKNIDIQKELEQLDAMRLMKIERSNPYHVPNNYFGELKIEETKFDLNNNYQIPENYFENNIESVIEKVVPKKKVKFFSLYRVAAASVLVVLGFWFYQNATSDGMGENGNDVSWEQSYLEDNLEDYDLSSFVQLEDMEDNLIESDFSSEFIDEYLESNLDEFEIEELNELL